MVIGVIIYIVGSLLGLTVMLTYHKCRYRSRSNYTFTMSDLIYVILAASTSWVGVIMVGVTIGEEIILWKKSNEIRKS